MNTAVSTGVQPPAARRYWLWYAATAATFLPAIAFYYVGEEAIFPITSLEMWYRGDWVLHTIYGRLVNHPPLLNWLIIPAASALGWEYVLPVTRAITITATCLTGLVIAWLARVLSGDRGLAAFSALVFITLLDVFFYRGWLAYVDPLFALFVVTAAAALWAACHRGRPAWLWGAIAALTLALLSKSPTAYVFYGLTALVLFVADRGYRAFLLSPASWAAHGVALILPLAWFYLVPGAAGQDSRLLADVLDKLQPGDVLEYLKKLALYPAETVLRLAPVPFIAAYYWRRSRVDPRATDTRGAVRIALWIAALNFLPYWIAPHSHIRYLIPVFPFLALASAWMIWRAGEPAVRVTLRWLAVIAAVKLVAALLVFPYYQHTYRGENYLLAARDIAARTAGHALYTQDDTATGLSVTAHVDVLRLPQAPLVFPPAQWDDGFVIAYAPDPQVGPVAHRYRLGANDLYLLCRGAACKAAGGDK